MNSTTGVRATLNPQTAFEQVRTRQNVLSQKLKLVLTKIDVQEDTHYGKCLILDYLTLRCLHLSVAVSQFQLHLLRNDHTLRPEPAPRLPQIIRTTEDS